MKKSIITAIANLKLTSLDITSIKEELVYLDSLKKKLIDQYIDAKDRYFGDRRQLEFNEDQGKLINGLVWLIGENVDRDNKPMVSLWRDMPMYNKAIGVEEGLAGSETEKVLVTGKTFKVSLIRDEAVPKTDTYYGTKILPHKIAIYNNDNDLIFATRKEWRFFMLLEGKINPDTEPEGLYEYMSKENPFKMKIFQLHDEKARNELLSRLNMRDNHFKRYTDHPEMQGEDVFVACIMKIGAYSGDYFRRNGYLSDNDKVTWFIFKSYKVSPTYDDALDELIGIHDKYDRHDFLDMLLYAQASHEDLNKMDLKFKHLLFDQASTKLIPKVREIMGLGGESYKDKALAFLIGQQKQRIQKAMEK